MDSYGAAVPTGCALCVWSQHHTAVVSFKASGFTGFKLRHCRLSASTTGRKIVRKLYLFLAFVGFVLPYYFFVSFLVTNGPDLPLLFDQLLANDISTFFAVDLIITAIVFWAFLYRESQRYEVRNWWTFILATLVVGPSFALPLFLYFRESRIEALTA